MKLTKPQRRALQVLYAYYKKHKQWPTAHWFAEDMWPYEEYQESWDRVHNCGANNGATRGAPMWMNAGVILHRLQRMGLVESTHGMVAGWSLTMAGQTLATSEHT